MIYWSSRNTKVRGFSLIEVATALMILAFISTSVLVVINRCMASAADSAIRMQAFDVARENMEKLLTANSVRQTAKFGTSDKYPQIQWQSVVEAFYEPITQRLWVRGVCSAEYADSAGETQSIELTHWLTDVTKQQMLELLKQLQKEEEQLAAMVINTIEEAAEYAGVEVQTIEQWVENGLLTTEDGSFIKNNIDVFKESDGNPTAEAKSQQAESVQDITEAAGKQVEPSKQEAPTGQDRLNDIEPVTGLTYGELEQMEFWELWQLLMKLRDEGKL